MKTTSEVLQAEGEQLYDYYKRELSHKFTYEDLGGFTTTLRQNGLKQDWQHDFIFTKVIE